MDASAMTPLALHRPPARPALPLRAPDVQVVAAEPVTPLATLLRSLESRWRAGAEDVHPQRDGLHVAGADTDDVPAKMVQRQAGGDRAGRILVGEAVGADGLLRAGLDEEDAVAAFGLTAGPLPANAMVRPHERPVLVHHPPEADTGWDELARHERRVA